MKGLSTNTKTIATLFLFVCLAANSQVFQSNFNDSIGSISVASSSAGIERSSVLPSNASNCVEKGDVTEGTETFRTSESDVVDSENLREKDHNYDDIRDDGYVRNTRVRNTTRDGKITFKLNFKTYTCDNGKSTRYEYKMIDIKTPEGNIKCPGDCKAGVLTIKQGEDFAAIANKILKNGVQESVNIQYELTKNKEQDTLRANKCEGTLKTYSDGYSELLEFSDTAKGDELYRKCLVRRIKNLNISRRNRNKNKSESLKMFSLLEQELTSLAESKEVEDRKIAIKLIDGLSNKRIPQEIKTTMKNIRNYAIGANTADLVTSEYDKQIEYYQSQACSINSKAGCLSDQFVQTKINSIKMYKQRGLEFGKHNSLNQTWSIHNGEGGDESYKTWHTNLTNYFDQTMAQIQDVYTGPESINQKLDTSTNITNNDYNTRDDFLNGNNKFDDLRPTSSVLPTDVRGLTPEEINLFTRK